MLAIGFLELYQQLLKVSVILRLRALRFHFA